MMALQTLLAQILRLILPRVHFPMGSSDLFNTSGSFSSGQLVLSNGTRETLTTSGTGTTNSKNAGVASTINSNASGLSLVDGTNDGKAANYTLTLPSGTHGFTVTPIVLGLSGSKVYDGGAVVLASEFPTISGLIGSKLLLPVIKHPRQVPVGKQECC